MHVNTFSSVNLLTASYVANLRRLRQALLNQLAQIDSQILVCEDFADAAVDLPLPPEPEAVDGHTDLTEPEIAAGTQTPATKPQPEGEGYVKPLFARNWEAEQSAGKPKTEVNAEGRPIMGKTPILNEDDLKRLEAAVATGN